MPLAVNQAKTSYTTKKDALVSLELDRLRDATQILNAYVCVVCVCVVCVCGVRVVCVCVVCVWCVCVWCVRGWPPSRASS